MSALFPVIAEHSRYVQRVRRRYAAELFTCYGLPVERDVCLTTPAALLDGLDREHGLGFRLRDGQCRDLGDTGDGLDGDVLRTLAARGVQVQLSDPQRTIAGNDFPQVLAYLATLVEFLNQHMDGPDVDLSAVLERVHPRRRRGRVVDLAPSVSHPGIERDEVPVALAMVVAEPMLHEKLGGGVGVESQVGAGSRFWFELPAQANPPGS